MRITGDLRFGIVGLEGTSDRRNLRWASTSGKGIAEGKRPESWERSPPVGKNDYKWEILRMKKRGGMKDLNERLE